MFIEESGIRLLPGHALVIEKKETILVAADLHLGKSAAFRAHGLPVPEGDTVRDLERLGAIVEARKPDRLVIAGDLFHANSGQTKEVLDTLLDFIGKIKTPFTLVKGNHDRKILSLPAEIDQLDSLEIDGILIVHKPEDSSEDLFNICGHVHPVVKIPDGRNTSLRLPCFHLRDRILTLPSFGSFTGGHVIKPEPADRIFVTHLDDVIEVPSKLLPKKNP